MLGAAPAHLAHGHVGDHALDSITSPLSILRIQICPELKVLALAGCVEEARARHGGEEWS